MWPAPLKMLSIHARNKQTQLSEIISLHSTDPSRSLALVVTSQECHRLLCWEQGASARTRPYNKCSAFSFTCYVLSHESRFAQDCSQKLDFKTALFNRSIHTCSLGNAGVNLKQIQKNQCGYSRFTSAWRNKNGFRQLKMPIFAGVTIFHICQAIDTASNVMVDNSVETQNVTGKFSDLISISFLSHHFFFYSSVWKWSQHPKFLIKFSFHFSYMSSYAVAS